jgi:hypothetical protein
MTRPTYEEMEFYLILSSNWVKAASQQSGQSYWKHDGGPAVQIIEAYDMEIHKEYYEDNPYYT